jgi:succinate dehydrogenase / fumarate reductase, membrane anchor subunit
MSLRTPLGRALGRGSAKQGSGHWWAQRLTAVALVPLALWFAIALATLPSLDYATVSAWIGGSYTSVLLILLVLTVALHSLQGVQVVIEDYVHAPGLKVAALLLVTFAHFVAGAAGVLAVLRVAFGSLP